MTWKANADWKISVVRAATNWGSIPLPHPNDIHFFQRAVDAHFHALCFGIPDLAVDSVAAVNSYIDGLARVAPPTITRECKALLRDFKHAFDQVWQYRQQNPQRPMQQMETAMARFCVAMPRVFGFHPRWKGLPDGLRLASMYPEVFKP